MDIEKYNGLTIDTLSSSSTQINNGIVIINFADNNAFELTCNYMLYFFLFPINFKFI